MKTRAFKRPVPLTEACADIEMIDTGVAALCDRLTLNDKISMAERLDLAETILMLVRRRDALCQRIDDLTSH